MLLVRRSPLAHLGQALVVIRQFVSRGNVLVGVTSHWVDKRLGKKGYGIWIAPIGLFFVAYQAPVALNFVCVRQDSLALILIFSCILFYFAILFIGGICFCF